MRLLKLGSVKHMNTLFNYHELPLFFYGECYDDSL